MHHVIFLARRKSRVEIRSSEGATTHPPHSPKCAEVIEVRAYAICKLCKKRSNGKIFGGFAEYCWTPQIEGTRKLNKRMAHQVGLKST